uniref:Serine/threonine-protein kinase ATR n=1 Tax=Glossina brevipalpis TaxID=37001 RepID=A0A1A9WZ82_9MUSC
MVVDRRKNIWKLLYSLVNCTATDIKDVFGFISDILCKEHSLIRQSIREPTNRFQDTFILWLVNKLIKSFSFQEEKSNLEENIKIQHKLLNSCLINRPILFEMLVAAYIQAIDQLIESYAEEDLLSDSSTQLHISAFTTTDSCLQEIDENFSFDCIQIRIEEVNDMTQALLQILDHCLLVGYNHFPAVFENSLLIIFKTLKECDIITKLYCFQYIKNVFKRTISLNEHLHGMFELTLRGLTVMWEQLPIWMDNNWLPQETLNDVIDESSSILVTLSKFHEQLLNQSQILQHSFSLVQSTVELHQWQSKRLHYDLTLLNEFIRSLIDFTFPLMYYYPDVHQRLLKEELNLSVKKSSESYFLIIRLLPPLITIKPLREESQTLLRYLWNKIESFSQKNYPVKYDYDEVIESVASLILVEHLLIRRIQQKFLNKTIDLDLKNLPLGLNISDLFNPLHLNKESVRLALGRIINKLTPISMDPNNISDSVKLAGLILRLDFMRELLSKKAQCELLELLLQPLKNSSLYVQQSQLAETSLDLLNQLQFKASSEVQKLFTTSVATITRNVFGNSSSYSCKSKFCESLQHFLAFGWLENGFLMKEFKSLLLSDPDLFNVFLKSISCINTRESYVVIVKFVAISNIARLEPYHWFKLEIMCHKCQPFVKNCSELIKYLKNHEAVVRLQPETRSFEGGSELPRELQTRLLHQLFVNPQYTFAVNHLDNYDITVEDCVQIITKSLDISCLHLLPFKLMVAECFKPHYKNKFLRPIAVALLQHVVKSLKSVKNVDYQRTMLQLLTCCTENGWLSEQWLYHFFKMTFFYLIHPKSNVAHEAVLCATEMCDRYGIQPIQLWNWYKRDALSLLKELIVYSYLVKGMRMTRSLKAFINTLGFSCVQEYICKYYRLLVAMIMPYCVKEPRCKGLIISISKITRKPIANLFAVSFLRTYSHIYLTEAPAVGNACVDLIMKCTGTDLTNLMNADVKQTVSEFLVYFNRSPQFVMRAFQCLLPAEIGAKSLTSPTLEFSNFIADRFLGVITYFQACLAEPNFEKSLKEETLYSLAQIMRLIGSHSVTQFRFKIMAMLSFVLTLHDTNLQNICLKIWDIFLHIVNMQVLGPSLSRVIATLQPLLPQNLEKVNDIYDYLILKNDSLLGLHIPNLYFLESEVNLKPQIRNYVKRQSDLSKTECSSFLGKLSFLYKQISNENLQVRVHGLQYLKNFISEHRKEMNHLTLDVIRINPLLENIVDNLMSGSCHEDRSMHLASAKCLGELGAIDPSYMPSNYSFESGTDISLSIHTDDFAILALTELCRAYQYQKDTKYVDNFSLAIQETLSVFGVSPKENKKLNVWTAIPKQMQQIMEPLLSSCYTASKREIKNSEHPLFKSNALNSFEDWAFAWSCRLIDLVQNDETSYLLNSYKPSMKRDSNILALFFPYILLHAVQECDKAAFERIFEEFQAVLSYGGSSPRDHHIQTECDSVCYKEFKSTKYSAGNLPTKVFKTSSHAMNTNKKLETCIKLCSEQLDFLQRWVREWQRTHMIGGKLSEVDQRYNLIEQFLKKFNKFHVSKANYCAGDYSRALLYLEEYIEENIESRLQEQLSFLIEIHGKLMDSDSVEGAVYLKKTNLTLAEEILVNRIVDRPQETVTCYEQLLSSDDTINQEHIKGMIDCYLRMDISATALLTFDGLWQKLKDSYTDDYFKECKSELLWRLGRYDELEDLLEDSVVKSKITNWNIQCAEAFLLFRQPNDVVNDSSSGLVYFQEQLDNIRSNILFNKRLCSGVNEYSYNHCYDEVIRLHMLDEVEKNKLLINDIVSSIKRSIKTGDLKEECMLKIEDFFNNWNARLNILQPKARVIEPVFCLRRNLLSETNRILKNYENHNKELVKVVNDCVNKEIGKLWIRSGQMNREAGCLQQAQLSLMKAEPYKPLTLFLEKAKLMWKKGEQTYTFKLLEENIARLESQCAGDIRKLDSLQRGLYAEAKFLQATYSAESMNICSELNLRYFKESLEGNRCSEKSYVHLAQYMEKIYDSYAADQREGEIGYRLLQDVMLNYAKSLKYGFSNVYQSLPRLLSIWLDFTSYLATLCDNSASSSGTSAKLTSLQEIARKMNDLVNNCNNILSTSIFYTAFSQLLSRICHSSKDVYNTLKNIIVKLIEHFPQQSLWMLLPVFKSCHSIRIKRCRLIFTDPRLDKPTFQKLLNDFNMLTERLIELTNKDVSFDRTYELSSLVRQLPHLFRDSGFSEIMLPFEKYMQISFPINANAGEALSLNNDNNCETLNASNDNCVSLLPSNPFPYKSVYIRGISEEVVVLRSAAKPKKISIECSDGLKYNVMVKPKDDLRRDFRLMEFNGLVKRYLHQDSQARHRSLRIRTYAAIPFNEECGLVEWLPNLNSFRAICTSFYRMRGLGANDRILRQCALPQTESIEKKRNLFTQKLLPRHPPVFHEWFQRQFPTPHSWYQARTAYVKTTAVMSMVGYILGLGDRHGENILFDETNGDAVHVDFNCLFNQGESFQYPEIVPFRLTHNMVFAMGPLGVEGLFRKCCEITLRVLKDEAKTLQSVLRPFVYDLGNLNRIKAKSSSDLEVTDPKAMLDVKRIEERLQGYVKKTEANSIPLSTEGQVNFLINEATDIDNLAAMYIGWGAFM